jgi:hypothetical protein
MSTPQRIVLMPHPVAEATVEAAELVPWNRGAHVRKFVECEGEYRERAGGATQEATLGFWCEYEPPTRAERTGAAYGPGEPAFVHRIAPVRSVHRDTGSCRDPKRMPGCAPPGHETNTDPWVFQDGFTWTVCRHHRKGALTRVIRSLSEGDLVLFGSALPKRAQWLLDTVLVVGAQTGAPRLPSAIRRENDDPLYAACVLDRLRGEENAWRPIRGKVALGDTSAPHSFVPAVIRAQRAHFARPDIRSLLATLTRLDDPRAAPTGRATQSLTVCRAARGAPAFWHDLVRAVTDAGLVLGTRLRHPQAERGESMERSEDAR